MAGERERCRVGSDQADPPARDGTAANVQGLAEHVSPNQRPFLMAIFNKDIIKLTTSNKFFQKEVYIDDNCQIVMMHIEVGDEIGEETHDADQTTFFVSGEGQAVVEGKRTKVTENHLIVIPKGAKHNIINKGDEPLKLFTVYSPPAEEPGVAHKTKEDAEAAEG
jgi:mannose-6-phosphate isomerase-like protein (cupin superfamily)